MGTQERICIYCDSPDIPSTSHIIPESLCNDGPVLPSEVCKRCNNRINREVESPVIQQFALIRNLLQLKGKRGDSAKLSLVVDFQGSKIKTSAKNQIELEEMVFVFKNVTGSDERQRRLAVIAPDAEGLKVKTSEIERGKASINWLPLDSSAISDQLQAWHEFYPIVFADPRCFRMIAKIAFEWWCSKRSAEAVLATEFDDIRRYILDGSPASYPIVSVLEDEKILSRFAGHPFGSHMIYTGLRPPRPFLVMIVGLFEWVHYKVVISPRFTALAKLEQLEFVNPQTGMIYAPKLLTGLGPGPDIYGITNMDRLNPVDIIHARIEKIFQRFNSGIAALKKRNDKSL